MNQETKKWIEMAEMDTELQNTCMRHIIQSHTRLFVIIVSNQQKR